MKKKRAAVRSTLTARGYAQAIGDALKREWGHLLGMRLEVAERTGAGVGTVKKWIDGSNGPSGEHLIKLMAVSDEVFDAVCALAGRTMDGADARERIKRAIIELKRPR